MLSSVPHKKQALMVLHFLDGHLSVIKDKIDKEVTEKSLQSKDGIKKLLNFFEKIYQKNSLADAFDKYISFEKLRRSSNTNVQ